VSQVGEPDPIEEYLRLGLALGRHVEGLVDAYYGPPELARELSQGPGADPGALAERARWLLGLLEWHEGLEPVRRRWIAAQVEGLRTTARRLAGEEVAYLDEVEACYGVRPSFVDEEVFAEAHRQLEEVMPGSGPLQQRYSDWRESSAVPPERLEAAIWSLAEDLRQRTRQMFGLPEGEAVSFELVRSKPWSGFNYYLGNLRSRVAINTDLPVLSVGLAHLVAHEAYPGHHTEHCRKEVGLVRRRRQLEETIFLVGTPQCLVAEGLADLGVEVVFGPRPEDHLAEHLRPLGIAYDPDVAHRVAKAAEALSSVRTNAAILIHDRGWDSDQATSYVRRWALVTPERAAKAVEFITDPTWRAYPFCYTEGLRLARRWVAGDPSRFERLITEPVLPAELEAARK